MNWIQITKDYAISSDERSWAIEKYVGMDNKTGKQKWKAISWHGTWDQATKCLCETALKAGNCRSLPDLQKYAESIRDALSRAQEKVEI